MIINSGFEKAIHTLKLCCQTDSLRTRTSGFLEELARTSPQQKLANKSAAPVFIKRKAGDAGDAEPYGFQALLLNSLSGFSAMALIAFPDRSGCQPPRSRLSQMPFSGL
jgi:hypothetical protein